MDRDIKKDIDLFSLLVSEINISKYNQFEFRKIVEDVHWNIFYENTDGTWNNLGEQHEEQSS